MNLVYGKEKFFFTIILVFSLLIWVGAIALTFGIILLYLIVGFLIYLFAHSGFIAYLKGNGVKVTPSQYPELYQQYQECCRKLEFDEQPDIYLLNSDGMLNALATRFLKRHYVVLYSSVVDAMKKYPDGLAFYMGHELGHIKRGHLNWGTVIFPGSILPIIGPAYSRAREYTCDLHGLKCCKRPKDAAFALAVLAAGQENWSKLNIREFIKQSEETGGFWMSFHEITGDYPWLCKRVSHIVEASQNKKPDFPRRSFLAGFFAMFVPRLGLGSGSGGIASLIIVVAIVGILAAVALPAYSDYTLRSKTAKATLIGNQIKINATEYIMKHQELPFDLAIINLPENLSNEVVKRVEVSDEGFILHLTGDPKLEGETLIYQPYLDRQNNIAWTCEGGSLAAKLRPLECPKNNNLQN